MDQVIAVKQIGTKFVAQATFAQKDIVKAAGFRWDPAARAWWTDKPEIAGRLSPTYRAKQTESIQASRAAAADVAIPAPAGLSYLPYQTAGIAYALGRANTLIGDEMGLGKTIQAIGVINADVSLRKILVICPASLKINWLREMTKWLVEPRRIAVVNGKGWPEDADVYILNYDILAKHHDAIHAREWDLLIADEAHYLKSAEAKRTIEVVGREAKPKKNQIAIPGIRASRKILMTGTPIPNRPSEAFSAIHYLDPATFPNFFGYAKRYCAGHETRFGWDFSGSSNLAELQDKLRATIMVRRKKADVLTELPAKRRQVIELSADGCSTAVRAEKESMEREEVRLAALRVAVELSKASDDPQVYRQAVEALRNGASVAFTQMSAVRHATAVAKIPQVIAHVQDALAEEGHKCVVFAHHRDILTALQTEFPQAAVIHGDIGMTERQAAVDRFQSDPACNLFIGQITAAGVGITLTAAAHVIFAELDWVPGNISQCEDRCHRIGQKDTVLVQHLVLEGSMDARMASELVAKQEVLDAALDNEREEIASAPVAAVDLAPVTQSATRSTIAKEAAVLSPEQVEEIHSKLRMLADMDGDRASDLNGIGFNRLDTQIGHSLANAVSLTPKQAALGAKIIRRYHKQVGKLSW